MSEPRAEDPIQDALKQAAELRANASQQSTTEQAQRAAEQEYLEQARQVMQCLVLRVFERATEQIRAAGHQAEVTVEMSGNRAILCMSAQRSGLIVHWMDDCLMVTCTSAAGGSLELRRRYRAEGNRWQYVRLIPAAEASMRVIEQEVGRLIIAVAGSL